MRTGNRFKELVAEMPLYLKSLQERVPITIDEVGNTDIPQKGVYVFFEGRTPIYVGRSNRLKQRIKEHSQSSSDHFSATLAFRIAKQEYLKSTENKEKQGNKQLMENIDFTEMFTKAKKRIAGSKIRFVEIEDQYEQAVFEIYASLELGTKWNEFKTH